MDPVTHRKIMARPEYPPPWPLELEGRKLVPIPRHMVPGAHADQGRNRIRPTCAGVNVCRDLRMQAAKCLEIATCLLGERLGTSAASDRSGLARSGASIASAIPDGSPTPLDQMDAQTAQQGRANPLGVRQRQMRRDPRSIE